MRFAAAALALAFCAPLLFAAGVTVRWDPRDPSIGPFPTDFLTTTDPTQKTGRRVNLPMPDCTAGPSDCQDVQLINQLDGFQTAPRIHVTFSAPIDVNTLYNSIYYVPLDNLTTEEHGINFAGQMIPINQIIYDPTTNTVYAKPDGNLDQHRHVALMVTDKIHDLAGDPVASDAGFAACAGLTNAWAQGNWYCQALSPAVTSMAGEFAPNHVVGASIFTTMSITTWLEQARVLSSTEGPPPMPTQPLLVIPYANIASLTAHFQTAVSPPQFADITLPVNSPLFKGVGSFIYGSFPSPNFLNDQQIIPRIPTGQAVTAPATNNQLVFHVVTPATPEPPTGYPVVIFGHGFGDSQWGGPTAVAATFAKAGFATIGINAVGHGFGPLSQIVITDPQGNQTTLNAGGRGVDLNGDGLIAPYEGCVAIDPSQVALTDCFRQTVVDLSQLVRIIESGLDFNGDGKPDLDANRIYYVGQSLGAMYGTIFSAIEPKVRASVLNVGGGSTEDIVRWSGAFHSLAAALLGARMPSLLNLPGDFNDNYVFPYQPVKVNDVPGAIAIQNALELYEWYEAVADAVTFAPHLLSSSLPDVPAKHILFQFARADHTIPNPAASRLIDAANMRVWTTEYRHDLALADGLQLPQDPHTFLALFIGLSGNTISLPTLDGLLIGLAAQQQVAAYLASDGMTIPDANTFLPPNIPQGLFEMPAHLPFDLGY